MRLWRRHSKVEWGYYRWRAGRFLRKKLAPWLLVIILLGAFWTARQYVEDHGSVPADDR